MTETFVKISEIIFPRVASLVITNYFTQDTKCLFRFGLNLKTMELKDFIAKTLISLLSGSLKKGNEVTNSNFSRIKFAVNMNFSTTKVKAQ